MRLAGLFVLLALIGSAVAAQQPATSPATVTLRGVVTTANDVPLPRVRVAIATPVVSPALALMGVSRPPAPGVLTDAQGQFTIRVPAAASVRLAFIKARYVAHTADIPREQTVESSDIRVRMSLAGAVSGQVLDRSGGRLMSATVLLQRLDAVPSEAPVSTTTNDLGEYRFGGLAEGRYVVTARPSVFALGADIPDREAIVNAAAVQSQAVAVGPGSEVAGTDLIIDTPSELDYDAQTKTAPAPEATGSLSGRVVGSDGLPIARAVVQAFRPFVSAHAVETDARGRFTIDGLSPGEYTVRARKYGFNDEQYGLDRVAAPARRVVIRNGQSVGPVDVMLTRGAAITGTIVDEFGEPAQDVVVNALQIQTVDGRTQGLRAGRSSRTDDRGQYRIFGLQPGAYVVQAVVGDALSGASGYLPLFYPGTPSVDQATPMKVDFGAAATGIDLTIVPTVAHRVRGVVLDSSGKPLRGEVLLAVSARSGAIQTDMVRTQIGTDGSFEFTNVGPGDYVLQANGSILSGGQGGRVITEFGMSFVTVDAGDPPPVQLRLTRGAVLSGRVTYEGVAAGPAPILTLLARPTDRDRGPLRGYSPLEMSVGPDGSFVHQGVFGPTVLQAQPQQNDWYLKSVVIKGQDVTDTPVDFGTAGTFDDIRVVISAFGATVTGRVADDRGRPAGESVVVAFSAIRDRWFAGSRSVKTQRPSESGAFTVTGLPPGDYWVAAMERRDNIETTLQPDLLESLSSGAPRISLGEGQTQDVTLRLVRR